MVDRVPCVPDVDACGYAGGKYVAGYGDYHTGVCDCFESREKKIEKF